MKLQTFTLLKTIFRFCIPAAEAVSKRNFLQKTCENITIVFDLEDGVQDVLEPTRTKTIKQNARKAVKEILEKQSNCDNLSPLGIRINADSTAAFSDDIAFLKSVNNVKWQCVFLPKINSAGQLANYIKTLSACEIKFDEVIPIIETVSGVQSINNIFGDPVTATIKRGVWGNHDFNLDSNHWPFQDYDSHEYWERIKLFINILQKRKYEYIHSAILQLNDQHVSFLILDYVASLCSGNFSQVALSFRQAHIFSQWQYHKSISLQQYFLQKDLTTSQKKELALQTIAQYKAHRIIGKSFSIPNETCKIISPQEFMAAQIFLKEHD